MFKSLCTIALLCLGLSLPVRAQGAESTALQTATYTLGPLHIDKKYISMTGPVKNDRVTLGTATPSKYLWVKNFRVDVLDEKGAKVSSEYLCHSWAVLGRTEAGDQKLLTVSQGLDEMEFPAGYAVRVENTPANVNILAQALNNNADTNKYLSYKLTLGYMTDDAAAVQKLKPLRTVTAAVMAKDVNNGVNNICAASDEPMLAGEAKRYPDAMVHFDVQPGRHEYRTEIGKDHPIHRGGTIHYIKLHLHPFGESLALVDKTTGSTLWKGEVSNDDQRRMLTDVAFYSSAEGIKIDKTHDYEIVGIYNNTGKTVSDGMAVLRLYVADDEADKKE
ncbi:MAG: hypothetical protein PW788_12525 [Micavibrio sp.]|nr:hypothetical protein [Micavibrio sp.]